MPINNFKSNKIGLYGLVITLQACTHTTYRYFWVERKNGVKKTFLNKKSIP